MRIWTILVPVRLKKPEKNGFGQFSYKFFVPIRVGLLLLVDSSPTGTFYCLPKPPIIIWLDGTIVDISTILVTMYYSGCIGL